ncbi:MAG: hypothetical protein ABSH19_03570 [Opitutales bacterium]|jgi:hypothetical protein
MRFPSPVFLAVASILAGCSSPTAPIPAPPHANSGAAMETYAPANPPGVVANSGAGGVQTLSATVPTDNPGTMAQGFCVGQIQSQLEALLSLSQVGMPMSGMESITQSQNIAHYFARDCQITPWPEAQPLTSKSDFSAQLGQWLANVQIASFKIKQQYIEVSPDRQQGRAVICLEATVTYLNRLVRYEGWYLTTWIPAKGAWLIQSVQPLDVSKATRKGSTVPQVYFDPYWGPGWGYY